MQQFAGIRVLLIDPHQDVEGSGACGGDWHNGATSNYKLSHKSALKGHGFSRAAKSGFEAGL